MGISEMFIIMLVYGGLFTYIWQMILSNTKIFFYVKSALLLILYVFLATTIWFTYQGQEYHINNHSGLESISFTGEAVFTTVIFSIFSVFILFLNIFLKRKRNSSRGRVYEAVVVELQDGVS